MIKFFMTVYDLDLDNKRGCCKRQCFKHNALARIKEEEIRVDKRIKSCYDFMIKYQVAIN